MVNICSQINDTWKVIERNLQRKPFVVGVIHIRQIPSLMVSSLSASGTALCFWSSMRKLRKGKGTKAVRRPGIIGWAWIRRPRTSSSASLSLIHLLFYRRVEPPPLPPDYHKRQRDTGKRPRSAQTRGDVILVEPFACPCARKRECAMPSTLRRRAAPASCASTA